jgi:LemA protein
MIMLFIALGVPFFLILVYIIIYNGLVSRKNQVENAFASIDVYLKKRSDLIPSLVETVKGYMNHERDTLEGIAKLRSQTQSAQLGSDDKVVLENKITEGIGHVMLAVEKYPDLKASANFMQLQRTMNEVEAQLAASRRAFNAAVTDYNNGIESFPSNIVAGMMKYERKHVFSIPMDSRTAVEQAPSINL